MRREQHNRTKWFIKNSWMSNYCLELLIEVRSLISMWIGTRISIFIIPCVNWWRTQYTKLYNFTWNHKSIEEATNVVKKFYLLEWFGRNFLFTLKSGIEANRYQQHTKTFRKIAKFALTRYNLLMLLGIFLFLPCLLLQLCFLSFWELAI